MASAAATMKEVKDVGSVPPWWDATALITGSGSWYFWQSSIPRSTWVPSTSWSMAFPISWRRPARLAIRTSKPSSCAKRPEICATSIECCKAFWPKDVRNFILPKRNTSSGCTPWTPSSRRVDSPSSLMLSCTSLRLFSTTSSMRAGWILPSTISFSSAILATSLRIGSKPDSTTASGVSSIINSTPVSCSKVRIFLPSRPMILPFISSLGSCTTETVDSVTWSAAQRWIASTIYSLAVFSASSLALASYSRIYKAVSCLILSSTECNNSCLAWSLVKPETLSSSISFWLWSCSISPSLVCNPSSFLWRSDSFFSKFAAFFSELSSLFKILFSRSEISLLRSLISLSSSFLAFSASSFASSNASLFLFSAVRMASSIISLDFSSAVPTFRA